MSKAEKESSRRIFKSVARPNDLISENAVLSGLIQDHEAMLRVVKYLRADDFFEPKNQLIFKALLEFFQNNESWNEHRLISFMESAGTLVQVGGVDFIAELCTITAGSINIENYARAVKNKSELRKLLESCKKITAIVNTYNENITLDQKDALNEASKILYDLSQDNSSNEPKELKNILGEVYQDLTKMSNHQGDTNWVNTGFTDLDNIVNGFHNGSLIILGGRPGGGKSALGLAIAQNVAKEKAFDGSNKTVLFFSLEMPASQLVHRIIAKYTEVNSKRFSKAELSNDEWEKISHSLNDIGELKLFIDDSSQPTVSEIYAKSQRIKAKHGLHLVVVDYVQLMLEKENVQLYREQIVADISRKLKKMAKDLKVPVLGLAQLNRESEKGKKTKPKPSELRESGALEQDADVILLLFEDEEMPGIIEVIVAKNRMGEKRNIKLKYEKEYSRFSNFLR